jgi:HEAT repeat protein
VGVRAAAAEALGELGGDEARRALEYALLHDGEPNVRAAAATALGAIGSARSTDTLLRALTERHSAVWHAAGEALWQLGEEAMDHVVHGLLDSEHDMRKAALRAVLWLSVDVDEEDMPSLDDPGWLETWGWLN